jgi:hypothetical protein
MRGARGSAFGAIARFWCDDLPPLDGRLRSVFYLLLLAREVSSSTWTLTLPEFARRVDLSLFLYPDGIFHTLSPVLGASLPAPGVLLGARAALVLCWLAAGVGLLWRLTAPLTALLYLLLYGLAAGVGITHSGHVALWTLGALCFCQPHDRFTLDTWLAARSPRYARLAGAPGPLSGSGFGRKLALLGAVASLAGGGFSKLWIGGLQWLDGKPIELFILRTAVVGDYRWPALARFLLAHPRVLSAAAAATVALELGSVTALFSRRLRPLILAAACAFHIGILLVMVPAFWLQMISYIPCVDWQDLGRRLRLRGEPARAGQTAAADTAPSRALGGALGCTLSAMWLWVIVAQIEYYPLSCSPMYAPYVTQQTLAALRDPAVRGAVARRALTEDATILQLALAMVCPLRVVDSQSGRYQYIRPQMGTGGWERVFFATVLRDLAQPTGDPRTSRVGRFLADHLAVIVPAPGDRVSPIPQVLRHNLAQGLHPDRVELVCGFDHVVRDLPADAEVVVIGAAPLGARERALLAPP